MKLGIVNKNKPLEIYKEDFEAPFLAATRDYYARESSAFIAANGVAAYMKKVRARPLPRSPTLLCHRWLRRGAGGGAH